MATNFAESLAVRKVSGRRNVEENPTDRDRPAATVIKRETTSLVSRRQSSVTALRENVSACHMSFYQGHLHTPLTEVSLKSCGSCTPMLLVRGRCRSLRVLVLLCRSSQGIVDRCGLQNEYPRHLLFSRRCRIVSATSAKRKIYRQYIVPRFYTYF